MHNVSDIHNSRMSSQAEWQKSRTALPWPEKIKQAEMLREASVILRGDTLAVSRCRRKVQA